MLESNNLLHLKPKKYFILVILNIFVFSFLFIGSFIWRKYDSIIVSGYVECDEKCYLKAIILSEDLENVNKAQYLKIDNNKQEYTILEISSKEIDYLTMKNYQTIKIETNLDKKYQINNQSISVTFLYNHETIIKKILKKII